MSLSLMLACTAGDVPHHATMDAPRIRLANPDRDAAGIAAIYADAVLRSIASFEEQPPDEGAMAERIRATLRRTPWLVAEAEDGSVAAYAYAGPHHDRAGYRWSVNISVYVRSDERGRGLGRALYDVLLPMLRDQGFVNAYAGIAQPNAASVALHEAIGMERIGVYRRVGWKHGRWVDVAWYGMRLSEPDGAPSEIRPPGEPPS
jgi:L-amino acid N-acyltransferase YncA